MIVFDLETQNLAVEVGGWNNVDLLRLAVGCTYNDQIGYQMWWEAQAADLLDELHRADIIVGFNIRNFDFQVLSFYGSVKGLDEKAFDILGEMVDQGKRRINLNQMATINLGETKTLASGAGAITLWRNGQLEELAFYCQKDVELTKRLFEFWETEGLLWTNTARTDFIIWPGTDHLLDEDEDEE